MEIPLKILLHGKVEESLTQMIKELLAYQSGHQIYMRINYSAEEYYSHAMMIMPKYTWRVSCQCVPNRVDFLQLSESEWSYQSPTATVYQFLFKYTCGPFYPVFTNLCTLDLHFLSCLSVSHFFFSLSLLPLSLPLVPLLHFSPSMYLSLPSSLSPSPSPSYLSLRLFSPSLPSPSPLSPCVLYFFYPCRCRINQRRQTVQLTWPLLYVC